MKTEFLTGLGISEEVATQILAEAGRDIEKHKTEISTLTEKVKTLQETVTSANAEIERYKSMDIESIQKAAAEWEEKAKEAERTASERISEMEYTAALKDALSGEKFTSEYARKGVFDEIKSKKLPLENGVIMGLADVLKTLRETSPDAFAAEQTKLPATATYDGSGKTPVVPNKPMNEMTYEELCALPPGFSEQKG